MNSKHNIFVLLINNFYIVENCLTSDISYDLVKMMHNIMKLRMIISFGDVSHFFHFYHYFGLMYNFSADAITSK